MKKAIALLLVIVMTLCLVLTGCSKNPDTDTNDNSSNNGGTNGGNNGGTNGDDTVDVTPFYLTLDPNVSGELDIMVWSGDSEYHEDIGHQEWSAEDITSQNVAAVYALAKAFNKIYPNVKINIYAKADDPDSNDTPWAQELENFKAEHGKYPDIYASDDLITDVSRGMVADLSIYSDDPLYQSFNAGIMDTMNYYGIQAGLPQFVEPWGVYVNRELAEDNNIDVPDPDWDIDDFTDFITSADNESFWGTIDLAQLLSFINTGTTTICSSLSDYDGSGKHISLDNDEVKSLLEYVPQWAESEIWTLYGAGQIDQGIIDNGWWWGYRFFCVNYVLAYAGDPWMLNTAALAQNDDGTWPVNAVESNDWDIYPRPATDYMGNTVGLCVDPMAIHNFAMDDGDPNWSDAEKAQMDLAYAFGSFWCGSTEAMQARADQMYANNGTLISSLNDSFPLVTGDAFYEQMEIWYSVDIHARYGDAELMPGFQEVVRLWEEGKIWDVSDKTYPYYVYEDGTEVRCMVEWLTAYDAGTAGVGVTDASWVDTVKANLADWENKANARFDQAEENLRSGLIKYYGFTAADFG